MMPITIEQCKTKKGYKITSQTKIVLKLEKLKDITDENWKIIYWTPIVTLCRYKEVEVTIHCFGGLYIKEEYDKKEVERNAKEIYEYLLS